jgi:hypothetical protein
MPILGIWASSFRSAAGPVGAYDALATVTVGSTAVSSVTFAGIPTGYKHLQIRWTALTSSNNADLAFRFNGDTSANYTFHGIEGNGTSASGSNSGTGLTSTPVGIGTSTASTSAVGVLDLLDYGSTTKLKTVRSLFGYDANGSGYIILRSGLWYATPAAVNSVTILSSPGNINQYSQFSLYGIR